MQEAILDVSSVPGAKSRDRPSQSEARQPRRRLERADEQGLLSAAREGDEAGVAAILAATSGLPLRAIQRAADQKSARALVSLVWRSGFTMRAGVAVQAVLGNLPPSRRLAAAPSGGYPLSRTEMEWQIELLVGRCSP